MSSNHRLLTYSSCLLALLVLLVGCTPSSPPSVKPGNRYATGFQIERRDTSLLLTIYSPWQNDQVMGTYCIRQPYRRLVANACTHVGYIKELQHLQSLVGISDKHLVYTPLADSVVDIGSSLSPDKERILRLCPDAILLSTYADSDPTPQRLQQLALPIIYINEWQETHPLARAEWIRVFGALTGSLPQADSIFDQVCKAYNQLTDSSIHRFTDSPSILSGQDFRGTWYVPAGKTFMAQLFRDAGFTYRYQDDSRTHSLPCTSEQVFRDFQDADIWVGVQARSLAELAQIDDKHTWFRAYQQGRVYSFDKRTTKRSGNDFWETGVVHPEYILNDLRLIQMDKTQDDSLYFTTKLLP